MELDEYGRLPEDERRRLAAAAGGTFIGDDVPTGQGLVRERDGSWWVSIDTIADWLDKAAENPEQAQWAPAWRGAASRLRKERDKSEARLQEAMKAR